MDGISEFDLLNSRLEGTNLIEASAGTGKTYTIAGLLLRLVLEKDIPVSEILVVTYTEAATSELKDRVRKRLREAFEAFSGSPTDDAFLNDLLEKHPDRPSAARKLNYAVNDFDQASIFTIHGFCMRALLDNAFASGMLFDAELVTSEELFIREILQDFWRNHFYTTSHLFYNYALEKGLNLESLRKTVRKGTGNPYLEIIPRRDLPDCSAAEAEFRNKFELAAETWAKAKEEISGMLTTHPALNRTRYREASIPLWVGSMEAYFAGECLSCTPCEGFDKFTADTIQAATKKGNTPPSHPLFEACGELRQAQLQLQRVYDEKMLGLRIELFHYMRSELEARKRKKNILFFDDLLVKLERALSGPHGNLLAEIIKGKYKAALIDEFQDTDSIQYTIFERIFGSSGSILFLIGDPKQAIYGFRGADIFTYLDASRKTSSRFTLSGNWRSEPALISAVNAVFSGAENPFVHEDIRFHPARPPEDKKQELLTLDGKHAPPLRVWFLRSSENSGGKPIGKEKANELAADAVAGEIFRLLAMGREGKALIGEKPLREGDIAVLVRKHREADIVRDALSSLGIHSVLHDMGNLFETHEAREIARVLASAANPSDERLLRAALVTDIIGIRGEDLDRFSRDESGWDRWLAAFRDYHEKWAKRGFFRMFRDLLSKECVLPRLMGMTDGERRCTNLFHLSEVLHKVAITGGLNMSGLVKWLSIQMSPGTPRTDEEHQLRLESDADAVGIVTIHKSKGLEYPVVFCPFAWTGSRVKDACFTFHRESPEGTALILDLGSAEQERHRARAEKEELAENLRLLYVALTRAKHRCYLAWGRVNGAETSAPAYLFHFGGSATTGPLLDSLAADFQNLDDDAVLNDLENMAGESRGTIQTVDIPQRTEDTGALPERPSFALNCRAFKGSISRTWKVSSFSSLVSSHPARAELADRDEPLREEAVGADAREPVPSGTSMDMFSFPKGPASGILLHEIFEKIDFASGDRAHISGCVANSLKGHGFDASWIDPVCEMVERVLATPLEPDNETLTLSRVKASDRLSELEFHFPLGRVHEDKLRDVLTRFTGGNDGSRGESGLERLRFQPLEGFMKGFIDLVFRAEGRFYIVDWKSNYLGPTVESYNREALKKAIFNNFYHFQYALYTVAVHRYLRSRIPGYSHESHFGGVYYLFVRGMDPARGPLFGIYRDRPSQAYVEALCSVLTG